MQFQNTPIPNSIFFRGMEAPGLPAKLTRTTLVKGLRLVSSLSNTWLRH